MEITIENCPSPGAQFSENTNKVLKLIYYWIRDNDFPELEFIEFRRKLEGIGINDNNARNIYPLMKNSGFIDVQNSNGKKVTMEQQRNIKISAYSEDIETKYMKEVNKEW